MASTNICWGIEIGAGAIKAIKLEAAGEEVNVLEFAIVQHPKVLSTPDIDTNEAIRVALSVLANRVDLSGAAVAVSVAGHSAFARFAKLPPVEPKKVPDIVKFEAVQQIPFSLDEVEWDYQTFVSPDSPEIEVGIFAMRREQIVQQMLQFQDVGIVPGVVTLGPVAAYNALAHDLQFTEQTEGTIILDVGTTSTDLIVADAGRVWIRTFPIGGHHFTEALVEKFSLSYAKAEKLKREAAATKHAKHVYQAMHSVYGDLAQDVQRSIGYYRSLHPDTKLTRLIGLGSTFSLPGMRRFLKQQLGLNVYKLDGFKRLSVEGPEDRDFQAAAGNLAVAYGLALQGLDRAALRANLMPVVIIRQAMWHRKIGWFGVAAAIAVATGGIMFLRPLWDTMQIKDNGPSPVIQDVASTAARLKKEAGDVTQSAPPSFLAPNLQMLTLWRDLYPRIIDDAAMMIETANTYETSTPAPEEGPAEPALVLESLDIEYLGTADEKPKTEHAAFIYETAMIDFGIYDDEPNEKLDPNETISQKRLIRVVMKLTTTRLDSQQLMSQTIDRWIRANRVRDGVPYRIVDTGRAAWQQISIKKATPQGVGAPAGEITGGDSGGARSAPVTATFGTDEADLIAVAPLPPLPSVHDPTLDLQTYQVIWTLEVLDPNEEGRQ
ncbi:MAG: type IV pilus assembly protein PilM [Planctomycetes bacterium]|nr:type IV pilus assembly protein PilM [Planctomycetota bacterium]